MAWVMVAVGGAKAFGAFASGQAAESMANNQAAALSYQAQQEQDAAERTARLIRRAGREAEGAAAAGYAAAGVKVGEGSAATVENQITRDVESDAFQAILEGRRKGNALQAQGAMARISGDLSASAGKVSAMESALNSFGQWSRASGWKSGGYNYNGDASGSRYSATGADIRARR